MSFGYSIDTGVKRKLEILDYIVFALLFCASAAIGFYHAYKARNNKGVEEFQLGGRKMHPLPVSLSLTATYISALTILGSPVEVFTNNTMYFWTALGMLISVAASAHIFVPMFYKLKNISCFEYLELRFGKSVRALASALFIIQTLVYMGLVIYAPSMAFEAVTGLSLWATMIAVGTVSTLYTTLGGMKTVLWTDCLQFTTMVAGMICILVEGSKASGGFLNAWNIANSNKRIVFSEMSLDPRERHSFWGIVIGGSAFWTYTFGISQAQVQRACSLPTMRKMKIAIWMNYIGLLLIQILTCLVGVVMYAFYSDCHPVHFGLINKNNKLLPLFVLDVLGTIPGLAGLFIAAVFSGGLSSISSCLNAISAVIFEDFIQPFCPQSFTKRHELRISKSLVIVIGCLQLVIAFLISNMSGLILEFGLSTFSIISGPLFGTFLSGMIFPWTNGYGAFTGCVLSLIITIWLGIGNIIERPTVTSPSPVVSSGCNWNVTSMANISTSIDIALSTTTSSTSTAEPLLHDFYRISYLWYVSLGILVHVIVSTVTSLLTGRTDPKTIENKLICPIFDTLFPFLPERIKKPLRFGVVYEKRMKKDKDKNIDDVHVVDGEGVSEMEIFIPKNE